MGNSGGGTAVIALIALVIAGYAAIISTGTLIWNIILGRRDKGKFRIILSVNKSSIGKRNIYSLVLNISNIGRRPALLTHISIKYKRYKLRRVEPGGFAFENGKRLEESESYTCANEITYESLNVLSRAKSVYAIDANGKKWKMEYIDFENFVSGVKTILEAEKNDS